jgi:DNA-binding MarR family transcriptional regulator
VTSSGPTRPSLALRDVLLAAALANHAVAQQLGLGLTDLTALDHLLAGGAAGTKDLAELLGIRSPSATALVDRLESEGLVRRTPHPSDRRRVVLEATPQAHERAGAAVAPLLVELDALARDLSADDQRVVADYLHAVRGILRRFGGGS